MVHINGLVINKPFSNGFYKRLCPRMLTYLVLNPNPILSLSLHYHHIQVIQKTMNQSLHIYNTYKYYTRSLFILYVYIVTTKWREDQNR